MSRVEEDVAHLECDKNLEDYCEGDLIAVPSNGVIFHMVPFSIE